MNAESNLIGYLLNALDDESREQVESYLRTEPDAFRQLELLRTALNPLEADRVVIELPAGLRIRTLARVAEAQARARTFRVVAPPIRSGATPRSWWRRADVLVAASLLLLAGGLLPQGIARLQHYRNILYCQNNLREMYGALQVYSDHHSGALPEVKKDAPFNVAGVFVPMLRQEGLAQNVSLRCPESLAPQPEPISLRDLQEEYAHDPEQFKKRASQLAGCYAYSLGYEADGSFHGLRYDPDQQYNRALAVLADRPPFDQNAPNFFGNSVNHGGRGQNVLFMDGHSRFCTSPTVGVDGDNIFLNRDNLPRAGKDMLDTVLGASSFQPFAPDQ